MAIIVAKIQLRRGPYSDLDKSQAAPGEALVVLDGDPEAPSGKALYIAFGTGDVRRLVSIEDITEMAQRGDFDRAIEYYELLTKISDGDFILVSRDGKNYRTTIGAIKEAIREAAKAALDEVVAAGRSAEAAAKNAEMSVSNALEEVAAMQETVNRAVQEHEEMKLNIAGKVDGAYDENGYLYLTSNDEVVAGPLGPFAGGGGGGGSGGNNAQLTVTNTTGWLSKTVAYGASCEVSITWSSIEDDMPTGNGVLKITVNGLTKATLDAAQGSVMVDLADYLGIGSNTVKINIADVYGNNRTVNFNVTTIAVSLTSTFDTSSPFTGPITFTYVPTGSILKTMHFLVDGREIGTAMTAVSGRQQSYIIPAQPHGGHPLEAYFTADISGETVESNHLYYEMICTTEGNTDPIIVSSYDKKEVEQYTSIVIPYSVYSPESLTSEITLSANGGQLASLTVDRTLQTWTYRADVAGELTLSIACGKIKKDIVLTVKESKIDVEAETENLSLYLSSYGRSNNEEDPGKWEYDDIAAVFEGFNFTSDGWQTDKDGITVLRVSGDARLTIPAQIFAQDFRNTGKTIEVEFATRNIRDYDAVIMSCMSGGRGFELTAQQATLRSEQSVISTQYKEDEHVRTAFVVEKRAENRLVYIYINGVMSGVARYPQDDDFSQTEPVGISVGSNDCTIDLYCIRVYDNGLTRHQVLNNWIADTQDGAEMLARYQRNNIFDDYGQIVTERLPADLPYLILEAAELPQYKGDKKTISGRYVDPIDSSKSFTFDGAQIDVQGTSSQFYARKNYKISFKNGFTSSNNVKSETYAMRGDSIPTDTFTFKADVASSEGANNVELARLYNDACPYKTPPQEDDPHVRQGIDGFPIVVFQYDSVGTTFLGKYNFNNDKGTPEVFGFDEGDESWEVLNNTSNRVLWKSADFDGEAWKDDFEARYPEDSVAIENLKALAEWLVSTDQEAATNGALPEPVSYGDAQYGNDTAEYRLAKFREELPEHVELQAVLFNYLFTELFLMVDNRAKNAFPTKYSSSKWLILPYDYDTAIGTNNEGSLVFSYELEDIDQTGTGADVFNGQKSVLWVNLRQAFFEELRGMYQQLRSTGALSYEDTEKRFEEHQGKWPEAVFNEDSYFKYLAPLETGDAAYLAMLQGSKAEQRKWWLYNRYRYLDSKYNAGDALSDIITLRGYAKADITVKPYADIYASVKYGSSLVQKRALRGNSYTLECPLDNVNDTEIYIYSCSQLADVGDLSGLMVGYANFSMAVNLQSLKLGSGALDYSNTHLEELALGNNVLLKTLDVRNCPNLTRPVDISGCSNIEEAYFDGTGVTGVQLPNGGILKTLHLPATLTNLTIQNQRALTDLSVPSYEHISTLRLENVGAAVDSREILEGIPAGSRVRVIGFAWEAADADEIFGLYDLLDTMRGLDESGGNMDKAQMGGSIHLESLTGAEMAQMLERYPNIEIKFEHITSYLYFYNYDGSELLHTVSVYDGGDGEYTWSNPGRSSTAQYTYSFVGWSKKPNSTEADDDALKAVTADRKVYAAYTATVRKYRVRFYNGSELLQTVNDVPYGGSARYTGADPEKTGVSDPENYKFNGWSPSPSNIQGDTDCYASYAYIGLEETITDTWEQIIANADNGTYKEKYRVGDTKIIDLGTEGSVCMQIAALDTDDLADGSGKAKITWISEQLLATSHRMNPSLVTNYDYPDSPSWTEGSGSSKNTWSTQIAYCANETAKAKWTISATDDGTLTIGYRTGSTSTSTNKLTLKVDGQEVVTDWAGNGGSSSTYATKTVDCTTGKQVVVEAEYTQTSSSSSYTGYIQFSSTGEFSVDAAVEDAKKRVFRDYQEGTGGVGGWEKSEMRAYLRETVKPLIPDVVRNRIKEVTKTQTAYNTAGSSFSQTTTDDVWIPDYYEVYSSPKYGELFTDNASRVKKKAGATSASSWWLRRASNGNNFSGVSTSGSPSYYGSDYSYGVALGFCF